MDNDDLEESGFESFMNLGLRKMENQQRQLVLELR